LSHQAGDGFLDRRATRCAFGDGLIEGSGDVLGARYRSIQLCGGFLRKRRVFGGNQIAQARALQSAAIALLVLAQPHVADTQGLGDDVAVRVVGKAGMLVFLILRIQRHFHALARQFAA
jgi:hypothetical protein